MTRSRSAQDQREAADAALSLEAIRNVLARLEETIIFGLLERAQFCHNPAIYLPGAAGPHLGDASLLDFLLREVERVNALVRRYTSPDEVPFCRTLPDPILPRIELPNPLRPNSVNLNTELRTAYETHIVPDLCRPGDDTHWGSSAVQDVSLLQAMSKRIHYGRFVAESKIRQAPDRFQRALEERDEDGLFAAITDNEVESQVLDRVYRKASVYAREFDAGPGRHKVPPATVRTIYQRWIMPLNKRAQVLYLLQR